MSMRPKDFCRELFIQEVSEHLVVQGCHLIKTNHSPYLRALQRRVQDKLREMVDSKSSPTTHKVDLRGGPLGQKCRCPEK